MRRKEVHARTVQQDNDTTCFNSRSNNQKGSAHNRRAKRLASKRLRRILSKEQEVE
jgi:hypothetical protein